VGEVISHFLVSLAGPDAVHGITPGPLVKFERDPTYTSTTVNGSGTDGKLAIPDGSVFGRTTVVPDVANMGGRHGPAVAGPGQA
jgi:hypothetical protein